MGMKRNFFSNTEIIFFFYLVQFCIAFGADKKQCTSFKSLFDFCSQLILAKVESGDQQAQCKVEIMNSKRLTKTSKSPLSVIQILPWLQSGLVRFSYSEVVTPC